MSPDSRWVFLMLKAAPCACRCQHCCFAVNSFFAELPLTQTTMLIQPFVDVRDTEGALFDKLAVLLGDAPLNYPQIADCVQYLQQHGIEGWRSLPANGFHYRDTHKWQRYLKSLRQSGTEFLEFTLYGNSHTHDRFARRHGDFQSIHRLASLWRVTGGKTIWSIVIHKQNVSEIDDVRSQILDAYGDQCPVWVWSYLGHGVTLENLRLTSDDLDRLSPAIQDELQVLKTESAWIAHFNGSIENPFASTSRVMHIVIGTDSIARIPYKPAPKGHDGIPIGRFPVESVNDFLIIWNQQYDAWRSKYPALGTLCHTYGDASSTKLYDENSIKAKWCYLHDLSNKVIGK